MRLSNRLGLLAEERAPEALVRRVTFALDAEQHGMVKPKQAVSIPNRSMPKRRPVSIGLVVSTAAILLAIIWSVPDPVRNDSSIDVSSLLAQPGVAELRSSDAHRVGGWLEARVSRTITVPDIVGASLVGARLVRAGGEDIAVVDYELHGETLSYLVLPTSHMLGRSIEGDSVLHFSEGNYNLAAWSERGRALAIVPACAT